MQDAKMQEIGAKIVYLRLILKNVTYPQTLNQRNEIIQVTGFLYQLKCWYSLSLRRAPAIMTPAVYTV